MKTRESADRQSDLLRSMEIWFRFKKSPLAQRDRIDFRFLGMDTIQAIYMVRITMLISTSESNPSRLIYPEMIPVLPV